jgi:molybdenum cofactor biosynthesis protein B
MSAEHPKDQKAKAVFALVITSDTRTAKDDESGRMAVSLIEEAGHSVASRTVIPNDSEKIRAEVRRLLEDASTQVIVTSGGTGIGAKDRTVDAVSALLEKEMPGFGEHFRRLSLDEVGGSALISRATAGVAGGKLVFCLPGSRNAMGLALSKIILPNVGHMLWELSRR